MKRFARHVVVLVFATAFASAGTAWSLVGLSLKAGVGYIPDGSRPGALLQADIGPISPFAELFRKSGTTTTSVGVNIIPLRLPAPLLSPYIGGGGGVSRISTDAATKNRAVVNGIAGADLKLPGTTSLFAQVKYIYTLGGKDLAVRDVALQAGLRFYLGL